MAQSDILLSANNRNQLYVLQYSSGQYKQFIPLFDELEDYLITLVAKNPEKFNTAQGYKELQVLANDKIDELIKSQNLKLVADYHEFAEQQAEFVEMSLNRAVIGYSAALPSLSVLMKEVRRIPMVLGDTVVSLDDLSAQITTDTKKNVNNALLLGYTRGQTTDEIITNIRGNKTVKGAIPQSKLDTERVVRTSLNHVATTARQRANKENRDLVIGYRWLSTLDSRTSAICRDRDGQVYLYEDSPNPLPPAHFMCVLGDTNITTCSDVSTVFKREYKGAFVNIRTKSGRTLVITPNHPILTDSGWKAAKLINTSDKLATIPDSRFSIKNYKNSVKATAADFFSSVNVFCDSTLISDRPATTKDFHGDTSNGHVNIINVDGFAWSDIVKGVRKNIKYKSFFVRTKSAFSLNGFRSFYKGLSGFFGASTGFIGGTGKVFNFFWGGSIHSCLLLFGAISKCTKLFFKNSNDRSWGTFNAEVLGNSIGSDATFIALDDVVDFSISEDDCVRLVYNLENKENWYLSNGIITHNCRSTTTQELKNDSPLRLLKAEGTRSSRGAEGGKQVSDNLTYYEWLKTQPASFQDEALGKTRGLIFRNSGLSAEEFKKASVNRFDQPLTLEQMRQKNKEIDNYLSED